MWGYIVLVLALDVAPDVSFIEPIDSEATCTAKAADWIHKAREWRQRSGLRPGTSVAICYPHDALGTTIGGIGMRRNSSEFR